jgi:hypothetical protein
MMIQLPIYLWPYRTGWIFRGLYGFKRIVSELFAPLRRLALTLGAPVGAMRMHSFSAEYLFDCLGDLQFEQIELLIYQNQGCRSAQTFVLARKP